MAPAQVATSETPQTVPQRNVISLLVAGGSALGIATVAERGLGFIANLAAARIGGAPVFGAYSVAMTTANNIASYAGAGIGNTANRFSGDYPYGHSGYRGLLKALATVSLGSAALASVVLWFTAGPLAQHLLRNPALTPLLRLAAISAGVIILLECLRGFLIGQRKFVALVAVCILSGGGLIAVLPLAASRGPSTMVIAQASVALSAVAACVLFARKLRLSPPANTGEDLGPRAAEVLRFGFVQLGSMIGLNAAGWWIASLVARADVTLVQMALYSAAVQMRNMSAMPSWLISQTAYAQLTEASGKQYGGPGRVTLLSTVLATIIALMVAGPAAALMPWIVPHLYGKSFAGAELAASLAVITGLVHMSGAPAANRLTVVSLRLTAIINTLWALVVVGLGTWWLRGGGADQAIASFLAAHVFSALAVLVGLISLSAAPRQLIQVSTPAVLAAILLTYLAWLRSGSTHKAVLSLSMFAATLVFIGVAFVIGRRSCDSIRFLSITDLLRMVLNRAPAST